MSISPEVRAALVRRYGKEGAGVDQQLLERIIDEVAEHASAPPPASPFDGSWMDSYVAHWALGRSGPPGRDRSADVAEILRAGMDARFEERKAEILAWIRGTLLPPDGGPPEPGTPPVGPLVMVGPEPPDGGPPEPGTPPVGPSAPEPPDGGPPEPGVPPVGPDPQVLGDNPWILYWLVSVKAPALLDMLDAHLTRRLGELGFEPR
jgi:hypothetical protein